MDDFDFVFSDHFSIWMVRPTNAAAREYLESVTDGQWFGGALAVEPRYVGPLSDALADDGYSCSL